MYYFARNIHNLLKSNCVSSHLLVLLKRNTLITCKEFRLLTTASLSTKPCFLINSINLKKVNDQHRECERYFSKKKGPKRPVEIEEESYSDNDEEQDESIAGDDELLSDTIVNKNVASLRLDTIIKAGLNFKKKKIEQEFYAFKLRVNGKPVVKKAVNVYVGDEIDVVKGFSPDTSKYLVVDRITIKGIDKITGSGLFPVKMEILKKLIIENYEEPWNPSSTGELDK